ncbi:esterase [Sphaerisporangium krabiense]|uniref:CubicO group peptidase (Beta-lactamase class C family) n=1 Tax=Sphaerisporangium krabiense TaxID=763782 RepID=A0A7W9DRX7_9ACTN|nr:serine hydrolase domain-containing protein [Sphaerisporangium krabiense]MBB5628599.1 CubicO group peptidase (beta-lactamase class C family) [Sphaerisporangium krabiense]GII60565.1 esterase [Sphaerisporangium krabiense]
MTAQGHCDPRFDRVRRVFDDNFARGEELGAAFAVHLHGEPVVDLWDGVADRHTGRPWERETPVLTYSCTKAVTATVLLWLAERGLVDLRAPVAKVWPEFAAHGKDGITVEWLLTHEAGLPVVEQDVPVAEFEDQPAIAARLAGQSPLWTPGAAHGYHALTFGFLTGEVIRRVAGATAGEIVAREIAGPRGLDLWLGAPDDVAARAARMSAGEPAGGIGASAGFPGHSKDGLMTRALGNPNPNKLKGGGNHPVIMRAGWPAMGMVATARGLAGFYRDLVAGEIVARETLEYGTRVRVSGPDRVMLVDSAYGLGFMRPSMYFLTPRKGAETAFGHTGLGGALGLGDPRRGLAMAYTMNRMMTTGPGALRAYRLASAVYDCLS